MVVGYGKLKVVINYFNLFILFKYFKFNEEIFVDEF